MILEQIQSLSHWQIDLLTSWLLLQSAVVAVAPEEVIIITLGLLWGQGKLEFVEALLSVLVGLLPANWIMVLIGQKLSAKFAHKRGVQMASQYLKSYGPWLIFVTRFTPMVRAPVYLSVGASRYGLRRFSRVDALAACFQVPLLLILGRTIGARAGSVDEAFRVIAWVGGSLLGVTLLSTYFVEKRRKRVEMT
jgi:membrane protein DedA with SNARE-associated domain